MLTAIDARIKSSGNLNLFNEILDKIDQETEIGSYFLRLSYKMPQEITDKLIDIGYIVVYVDERNGSSYTNITWNKSYLAL